VTHRTACLSFVLACACLSGSLAYSLATSAEPALGPEGIVESGPVEVIRHGTPTTELPEMIVTPQLDTRKVGAQFRRVRYSTPVQCRWHRLEQGGSPVAQYVWSCG
jgi:hypothetical protein